MISEFLKLFQSTLNSKDNYMSWSCGIGPGEENFSQLLKTKQYKSVVMRKPHHRTIVLTDCEKALDKQDPQLVLDKSTHLSHLITILHNLLESI